MTVIGNRRSIPDILSDAVTQAATLVRKEAQLARAEVSENINKGIAGLGTVVAGAVLLIPALVVLLQAVVMALVASGMTLLTATVLVGAVVFAIGLILLFVGMNRLKAENLVPDRTINQLQRDASAAKEQMRQSDDQHRAA